MFSLMLVFSLMDSQPRDYVFCVQLVTDTTGTLRLLFKVSRLQWEALAVHAVMKLLTGMTIFTLCAKSPD